MPFPDSLLPRDLIERSTLRGNERAWPIGDIPKVIEAARLADLISIGGQLQFRIPDGGTCECYWVEVDTYRTVPATLPWSERVVRTAAEAMSQFNDLLARDDFIAEGRKAFQTYLDDFEASGGKLEDAICFVWYVKADVRTEPT